VEAADFDNVPAGVYDGVVVSITRGSDGQFGPYLQWSIEITGPDGKPVIVSGRSSDRFGPTTKARRWLEAILGYRMRRGVPVDLDGLAVHGCRVQVDIVEKERGVFNRIVEILPAQMQGTRNPEPVTAEPDLDDDQEKAAFAEWLRTRKQPDAEHDDGVAA
jgi:hypothetical protein